MRKSRGSDIFICHICILQSAVRTFLEKQLVPMGSIASQVGSITEFLRKPIATCHFHGGRIRVPAPHLDLSIHFLILSNSTYITGGAIMLTDVGYNP